MKSPLGENNICSYIYRGGGRDISEMVPNHKLLYNSAEWISLINIGFLSQLDVW